MQKSQRSIIKNFNYKFIFHDKNQFSVTLNTEIDIKKILSRMTKVDFLLRILVLTESDKVESNNE